MESDAANTSETNTLTSSAKNTATLPISQSLSVTDTPERQKPAPKGKKISKGKKSVSATSATKPKIRAKTGIGNTDKAHCATTNVRPTTTSSDVRPRPRPTVRPNTNVSPNVTDIDTRLEKLENMLSQFIQTPRRELSQFTIPQTSNQGDLQESNADDEGDVLLLHDDSESDFLAMDENLDEGEIPPVIPTFAAKFAVPTDVGHPVDDEIAQSVLYMINHKLEQKVLEETAAKYPPLANCELVDSPKVNPSVWDNIPTGTKTNDLKFQRVQEPLVRGISAFISTLDATNITEAQQDALALLCSANFELNSVRKEFIKPNLNSRFTHLCKPSNPVTKLLFGDDLTPSGAAEQSHGDNEIPPESQDQPSSSTKKAVDSDKVSLGFIPSQNFDPLTPFVGGQLKLFYNNWCKITSDPFILRAIKGYTIEVDSKNPPHYDGSRVRYFRRKPSEQMAISNEIIKLHEKGIIEPCARETGDFLSNIFTRPKKDGGLRLILDLSDFNQHLLYKHFKMDNIHTAIHLVTKNCYLASVDLKDAYYSVAINENSRKFLKFEWLGSLWQYKALPNGLSTAPRLFTKLLKPVLASLRQQGHTVIGYLDDTLIIANTLEQANSAIEATVNSFSQLGFTVHPEKSVLKPSHEIQFLGFVINSKELKLWLPKEKALDIQQSCTNLLQDTNPSIRHVAAVIGKLVAALPAVQHGQLFYRALEKAKILALKYNAGHFDRKMKLPSEARLELHWWISNITSTSKPLRYPKPTIELRSDASGKGWGATDMTNCSGGRWNTYELQFARENKINYLEILAAYMGLKCFCKNQYNVHVLLRIDNTTAVSYINNMGGIKSPECNNVAKLIWDWCRKRNIWLTAAHLPGKLNVEADVLSRQFNDKTEWMLNRGVFKQIVDRFGQPEVDLFASRLNKQVNRFVSWLPDPEAEAIDAFTLDWGDLNFYAFPPFCLIPRCLQKIINDSGQGIMVVCRPLLTTGLTLSTIRLISASWRPSTKKQYAVHINKWKKFCHLKGVNDRVSDVNHVLEFLSDPFNKENLSYSSINSARSALASYLILKDKFTIGDHPLISRLLKGIFNLRPPMPRYQETWDVKVVFRYLRTLSPASRLTLKQITLKLSMILALTSAQRVQSLSFLHLDRMNLNKDQVSFHFHELLKQHKPGNRNSTLKLRSYPPDRRLCVVTYLRQYIQRTSNIRGTERYLLISYKKPYKRVTTSTIARWIKEVMKAAGINTNLYKAHSTRAAATSAASSNDLPITHILKQAGWSNEKTFRTFYEKPVENRDFSEIIK
ncbi:hypothetical protein HOLleu_10559 [Holothuria leucospilota]|uniref:Uncharacterized protein n=2 Tax=Holothuria leucospilota TaxID=206669 RepID=A0A9Q1CDR4_HOLLE|nr:hypothetical protein HOLleu_10559 [Holothuria leucospilota]